MLKRLEKAGKGWGQLEIDWIKMKGWKTCEKLGTVNNLLNKLRSFGKLITL